MFLGDQSKSALSSAQYQSSLDILTSSSNNQISLDIFIQVFGWYPTRDYSEEQNGAVYVYETNETLFIRVIVEFSFNYRSVIVKEHFSFDFPIPVKEFSMEIQVKQYSGHRKNLDCHRKNSDCHRKNPDSHRKNPDSHNKNSDCHRKNSDCHNKNPDSPTKIRTATKKIWTFLYKNFYLKFSKNKIKCFNIL